jgi:MtN3 and saliva related transmembrane protein
MAGVQWVPNTGTRSSMELSDVLGYVAATLTTFSFVPQAWRTFRTKDVSGISTRMYSVFTLGVAVWLAYGIVLGEVPMMIANSTTLVLACAVLVMKLKYGKRNAQAPGGGDGEPPRDGKSGMARA